MKCLMMDSLHARSAEVNLERPHGILHRVFAGGAGGAPGRLRRRRRRRLGLPLSFLGAIFGLEVLLESLRWRLAAPQPTGEQTVGAGDPGQSARRQTERLCTGARGGGAGGRGDSIRDCG